MIKYKKWAITMDAEYPVVNLVKVFGKGSKNAGKEHLVATYFPRDIQGALEILHRVTTTDATRDCKTLKEALKALNDNHNELLTVVREYFDE